jgi:uncharacterized protein
MTLPTVTLILLSDEYSICRLQPSDSDPAWASECGFTSIVRTADELSVLCPTARVPGHVRQERGWRLFKFQGPFAFTETGVLASVLSPLAAAQIGILALSTFDTDYVLVKATDLTRACDALTAAHHSVRTVTAE